MARNQIKVEQSTYDESESGYKFSEVTVHVPRHDSDVVIQFPNGKKLTVQMRPSNADVNYNGSLDIILWDDEDVTTWIGDDMELSVAEDEQFPHERKMKQMVTVLPFNADE